MAYLIGGNLKGTEGAVNHPIADLLYERLENYASSRTNFETDWRLDYSAWRRIWSQPWKEAEGHDWRSKVFVGVTDLKVRIVAASMFDALKGFPIFLQPTPEPESGPGVPLPEPEALTRALRMQKKIRDLITQMKGAQIIRDMIIEYIVYGNVFTYCPVMVRYRKRRQRGEYITQGQGFQELTWRPYIDDRMQLGFQHLNVWDVFKDPNAQTPQDGEGIGDRKMMSGGEFLRFCQSSYGFIKSNVNALLAKARTQDSSNQPAPLHGDQGPEMDEIDYRKGPIEVFRYAGRISKAEIASSTRESEWNILKNQYTPEEWKENEDFEIIAVIAACGDRFGLMKCSRNPNFGFRPYQQSVFRKIPFRAYGDSLPRAMRDSQMMINSLTRAIFDNLAFSAVAAGVVRGDAFETWEDNTITPGHFKQLVEGFVGSAEDAMSVFKWPNYTNDLMPMLENMKNWASEESVPNLLGGQREESMPRTAFQTSKLWEGAQLLLSEPLQNFDDGSIVPIGEEFYHYLMSDPEVPAAYKGDFTTKASGYRGFEEKHLKSQKALQLMQVASQNEVIMQLTNMSQLWKQVIVAMDEDPDKIIATEQELAQRLVTAQKQLAFQAQQIQGFQKMMTGGVAQDIFGGVPGGVQ